MNIASYLSHYIRENYVSLILEYLIAKTFELVKETLGNLDSSTTEELNFNPKPKHACIKLENHWKNAMKSEVASALSWLIFSPFEHSNCCKEDDDCDYSNYSEVNKGSIIVSVDHYIV